jgi:collagenase-like PrtC family protease
MAGSAGASVGAGECGELGRREILEKMGLTRVILSRELSLDEVEEIRQECPDMELEVFVHGALCIAYSGRCLLSGYFNHRDPNQGTCTNSCRWDYKVENAAENETGDLARIPVKRLNLTSTRRWKTQINRSQRWATCRVTRWQTVLT